MQEQCLAINIAKGEASHADWKAEVLSQVAKTDWPLETANKELSEGLLHALHNRVKWGDRPMDAANLSVILMKVGP